MDAATATGVRADALRSRLQRGERILCTFNALQDAAVVELVGVTGLDAIVIDLEHGPGGLRDVQEAVRAAVSCRTDVLVRTPRRSDIGGALDLGATGVLVPMVEDARSARSIVADARFPPEGHRGLAGSHRASGYGTLTPAQVMADAEATIVAVQLETEVGIGRAAEISAVEGLDMVFVGPTDLAASTGRIGEADDVWFRDQISRVTEAAEPTGTSVGTLVSTVARAQIALELGVTFLAWSTTVGLLRAGLSRVVEDWRGIP